MVGVVEPACLPTSVTIAWEPTYQPSSLSLERPQSSYLAIVSDSAAEEDLGGHEVGWSQCYHSMGAYQSKKEDLGGHGTTRSSLSCSRTARGPVVPTPPSI